MEREIKFADEQELYGADINGNINMETDKGDFCACGVHEVSNEKI